MNTGVVVNFKKATKNDIDFLSLILVNAAVASGVKMQIADLPVHPDTYQYVEGFPKGADTGIVAQTNEGILVGAAWVRLLPTATHAINEPLPELTMGVISEYQRMGIGKRLMEELYKAVQSLGISKISLGVHKDNIPAINLYKQQNWVEDGSFEQYIMMSKRID
ncbi:MAG: GNAT family N-acetyltransferase [Parabacteroides sp.]|jgi:ribosomal protein S18 acetylase RimI-like enzyme